MKIDSLAKLVISLCCCWTSLIAIVIAETVYDAIRNNPELSKFKDFVNKDEVLKVYLDHRTTTVFAPSNEAFNKFHSISSDLQRKIASYHVVGLVARKNLFPTAVSSQLQESAPLFLTIKEFRPPHANSPNYHHNYDYSSHQGEKEFFVNNARITDEREYTARDGSSKQLLYIVDEVLEPFIPKTPLPPTALEIINQASIYDISESLGAFANRVRNERQESLYDRSGNHTFFVPVGDGQSHGRFRDVDSSVIRGHIVPNHVLFVRVMGNEPYQSEAYNGSVKVELSLLNRTIRFGSEPSYYAQSNTLQATPNHNKGVVMSRVVRANIPVKNGVLHLIEKPLMIIDISIWDFLNMEQNGRLSQFHRLLEYVPEIRSEIQSVSPKTILAPTNEAFAQMGAEELNQIIANPEQLKSLLRLHMARQSVSSDDVYNNRIREVPSADEGVERRSLYFRVIGDGKNKILTVEGGGVTATAKNADIGATNGIIHIIDRVLGQPFQTVYEKLKTDPDLNTTYALGNAGYSKWNDDLSNMHTEFTYFVPSNQAWESLRLDMPSEHKQLTTGIYPHHAKAILDRHLLVGRQIKAANLIADEKIRTRKGEFTVRRGFAGGFPGERLVQTGDVYIEWEGMRARIVRPDVQALNGVIHVIDRVMMKKRDLNINGSSNVTASIIFLLIAFIFSKLV